MAKTDININPNVSNVSLDIEIPIGNISKFRCKIPNNGFGQQIKACDKNTIIPNNAYIEWQIGYYTDDSNRSHSKIAILTNFYSFELSDILKEMKNIGLLTQQEINNHITNINSLNVFLNGNIFMQNANIYNINNIQLQQKNIVLPSYYLATNNVEINVLYEKQQRACGIQPMVFLNIPLSSFTNGSSIINHNGKSGQKGNLKIDNSNKNIMIDLIYIFASLSINYKNDIVSILQTI
jgi:hypothetical protein